jgi:hypothetical protein
MKKRLGRCLQRREHETNRNIKPQEEGSPLSNCASMNEKHLSISEFTSQDTSPKKKQQGKINAHLIFRGAQ